MNWADSLPILFGALLGFVLSIITTLVNLAIDKSGKLKVYYVIYNSENITGSFSFASNENRIVFIVPMRFEIQNTSNTTRVLRDISVFLYNNGRRFKKMVHVAQTTNSLITNGVVTEKNERQFGAHNNSYSFVIPPRTIQCENCNFMYAIDRNLINDNQFDEIKLMYFDEKDKEHIFNLRKIENCWIDKKLRADEDWVLAK